MPDNSHKNHNDRNFYSANLAHRVEAQRAFCLADSEGNLRVGRLNEKEQKSKAGFCSAFDAARDLV